MFYKDQQLRKGMLFSEKKKIEHANENEFLLSSFGVVLEVNERGEKLLQNFEGSSGMNV